MLIFLVTFQSLFIFRSKIAFSPLLSLYYQLPGVSRDISLLYNSHHTEVTTCQQLYHGVLGHQIGLVTPGHHQYPVDVVLGLVLVPWYNGHHHVSCLVASSHRNILQLSPPPTTPYTTVRGKGCFLWWCMVGGGWWWVVGGVS